MKFSPVEGLVGDFPDAPPPLRELIGALESRIDDQLHDLISGALELFRRGSRHGRSPPVSQERPQDDGDDERPAHRSHPDLLSHVLGVPDTAPRAHTRIIRTRSAASQAWTLAQAAGSRCSQAETAASVTTIQRRFR
jgi:hypothetical protein